MRSPCCLFAVLVALPSFAADVRGNARLWLGGGLDTNARRDFVSSGVGTVPDGFLFALAQLDGQVTFAERLRLVGGYDGAVRKFVRLPSEDTLVQSAFVEGTVALGSLFAIGVTGRARDRRGAERDYTDLQGGALIDFFPNEQADVRLVVSAHRFIFWNRFAYSFYGPDGTLSARYRFNRRHAVSLFGTFNPRTYNADATARPGPEGQEPPQPVTRRDNFFGGGVSYSYRGPFHLTVGYAYYDQASNSYGETIRRHRISATAGVRLPWKVTALASGTLQLSSFPDGVYLSPDLTVVEDDENSSSVTLKLVRPVHEHVEVDLRYAMYVNVLPLNQFFYMRHVVSLGLAITF